MNTASYAFVLSALVASGAVAQQKADDQSARHGSPAAATASQSGDLSDGEVRRIDKAMSKITLRHGEIKNLDMPGMTMVFQAADPALLDKVKVGDRVKFRAESVNGVYQVTAIEAAQ